MNTLHGSTPVYDYRIIRRFITMGLVWGLLGTLSGLWLVVGMRWPALVPDHPVFSFGRVVSVHALMLLYGFAVNLLFAISYFVVQRTAQLRLANGFYSALSLWGLQVVVLLGVVAGLLGLAGGGPAPTLPWMLDLLLVLVWLVWILQLFATLGQRSRAPVYIALWFFISFGVVLAAVQLLTSAALPVSLTGFSAYSLFGGAADALLQQWQWHTVTVALLIGAYTGAYYYVLPRQLGRPLYSQALAIASFWVLLLSSVWIGGSSPHWSALPDWVGSIGSGFTAVLVFAVLGAPLNGYRTLNGRTRIAARDPVIAFLVVAMLMLLVFAIIGGLFALRTFSAWALDMGWSGIRIHSLGLGWTAMVAFASIYHLLPRVWGAQTSRPGWVRIHLWLAVCGSGLYLAGQWLGGLGQARALGDWDPYGNLSYGFIETLTAWHNANLLRVIGGAIFAAGLMVMVANLWLTGAKAKHQQRELDQLLAARMAKIAGAGKGGGA